MNKFLLIAALLFFGACSSKSITINGLICPAEFSQERVHRDITQCKYYDEKAAAEASKSKLNPECISCLEEKGYKLEK